MLAALEMPAVDDELNSPAELTPLSPKSCGRLIKHHNSICEVILLLNLSSMAQDRRHIIFGDLGRGFQIGINSGPIHLPPGTSAKAQA
jgi:hypothetical protein